jgi:hypothetical protein
MKFSEIFQPTVPCAEATDVVEGAEYIHVHHKVPDYVASATAAKKGDGLCAVEMCCHACGAAMYVIFLMPLGSAVPKRYDDVHGARDRFIKKHRKCSADKTKDFRQFCPSHRAGKTELHDFAGVLT